ncbi:hypothetical protein ACP4OV_028332 [Aristida adscensionis]
MPEMTFLVHVGGKICWHPKKCWDWSVGILKFLDTDELNWDELRYRLRVFGYKWEKGIDLYFLAPGDIPPDGLGLFWRPESFDLMMQMHDYGKKDCHLYVVKKPRPGSYDCGAPPYGDDDDGGGGGGDDGYGAPPYGDDGYGAPSYGDDGYGASSYGDDAADDGYDDGNDTGSSNKETKKD